MIIITIKYLLQLGNFEDLVIIVIIVIVIIEDLI